MSAITETEIKSMTKEQNYMQGYKDGKNDVLNQIKAEIESMEINGYIRDVECFSAEINAALNVLDKYREER